jgi:hypothetical protein
VSSNSGEVTLFVVVAEMANTPSPLVMWLSERVEKVEETMVELRAGGFGQRHCDGGARA